jgi:4,5-DOPA dioxygenase extradiol
MAHPDNPKKDAIPPIFIGHGSPENAIEENEYSRAWRDLAKSFPRPKAILSVSAHWVTAGTRVTAEKEPKTIHDFWGFQKGLYEAEYPAPGSPELADEAIEAVKSAKTFPDTGWGLDHGTWAVLINMYPEADIPVVQLSLDARAAPAVHYRIGKELGRLRGGGILILGSGNIVHNLGAMGYGKKPYGWAVGFGDAVKERLLASDHGALTEYGLLPGAESAVPTNEHYLPLLYAMAAAQAGEKPRFLCDRVVAQSVSMTSVVWA